MNTINVIKPYKYLDTWVFDDASLNITHEPFVNGADTIIDALVAQVNNADNGFLLLFSQNPFPNYQYEFKWLREEFGGNWYEFVDSSTMEGWLCPALLKYFLSAPSEIFIQIKEIK